MESKDEQEKGIPRRNNYSYVVEQTAYENN
jgi:hypothetical protein